MSPALPDWKTQLDKAVQDIGQGATDHTAYLRANSDGVALALTGNGAGGPSGTQGARVVVNISSAHIPSLTGAGGRYLNCYDLDQQRKRLGESPQTSPKREAVDTALKSVHGRAQEHIYFAAIELNGTGVGFYGDFCLVLKDKPDQETFILDRNSYDLIRSPLMEMIKADAKSRKCGLKQARADRAVKHAGNMADHLAEIAAIKVLQSRQSPSRLMTTGMVSGSLLEDEDYIEVLRPQSFDSQDIEEVRLATADVALEERIGDRAARGPAPSAAEGLWRQRRRQAEAGLRLAGIPVRVATTAGRTRTP